MKTEPTCYENYPLLIVFLSNFVSIAIYVIGCFLVYQLGIAWLAPYILYILFLEFRIMKKSCPNCYYYGKVCAFGKGKASALFFKKGTSEKFCQRQITWKDILPDFLVSIIPLLIGIALLITKFDLIMLVAVVLLALFTSVGNGFVRNSLACKHCKQRELGCPAEKLFRKKR